MVTGINAHDAVDIYVNNGTLVERRTCASHPPTTGTCRTSGEDPGRRCSAGSGSSRGPGTNQIAFIGLGHDIVTQTSAVVHAAIWDGDTNTLRARRRSLSLPVRPTAQNPHIADAIDIDFVLGGTNAGRGARRLGQRRRRCGARIWQRGRDLGRRARVVQNLGAGNTVRWIRQKAASNGDDMILAIEDVNERIHTIRYDGNTRAFSGVPDAHTAFAYGNADQNRPFDVAWDFATGPNTVAPRLQRQQRDPVQGLRRRRGHLDHRADGHRGRPGALGPARARPEQRRPPGDQGPARRPARVEVDGRQLDRHHALSALDQHREQQHQPERRDASRSRRGPRRRAPPRR